MNKKEFDYYKNNREEITPDILGKMFLFAEGYTMNSYIKGKMDIILSDKEVNDIINTMLDRPDWLDYKFYVSLVNTMRLYKQIMHTRVWEIEYSILILIHTLGSLHISEQMRSYGLDKSKLSLVEELLTIQKPKVTEENAVKTLRDHTLKIEACLRWVMAHNSFIDIVMKLEDINTIKSFKKDIKTLEKSLENCNNLIKGLCSDKLSLYPLREFKLDNYRPKKYHKDKVKIALKDKAFFLKASDRIDSYLLQILIFGNLAK